MTTRNHLHLLTCVALPIVMAVGMWANQVDNHFSAALKRRVQLGLPNRIMHVATSVGIAGSPENLHQIFEGVKNPVDVKTSKGDRDWVYEGLFRDYFFIVAYTLLLTLLGLRTWQRNFPSGQGQRVLLVVVPLLLGACDALENYGCQMELRSYPDVSVSLLQFTTLASWSKWIMGFLAMILLGKSFLGASRRTGLGAFLRELAGIILLVAGFVGLSGFFFPSMIPSTFVFGLFAGLPIGLMLIFRDIWWRHDVGN